MRCGADTGTATGGVLSAPRQPSGVSYGDDDPSDEDGERALPDREEGPEGDPAPHSAPDSDVADDADAGEGSDTGAGFASEPTDYAVPTDADTAWLRELADAGELTPDAVESMLALHDDRGGRAIEAVSEGRVKQYRDFTVVVGHEDEYVVEAGGCTCKDSAYNLDPDDPHDRCWHVLAVAIAERIGEVDHHGMWYSDVRDFV